MKQERRPKHQNPQRKKKSPLTNRWNLNLCIRHIYEIFHNTSINQSSQLSQLFEQRCLFKKKRKKKRTEQDNTSPMISEIGKLTGKLYPTEENSRIQTSFPCVKRSTVGELPILKSVPWKKKILSPSLWQKKR